MKAIHNHTESECFKEKVNLRTKVNFLINRIHFNSCQEFVDKSNSFNRKVIDHSSTPSFVNSRILKSKQFRFDLSDKPWTVHFMSTDHFSPDYKAIKRLFLKELSPEEIELISTDIDFFIKDKEMKDNLNIFNHVPLTNRIIKEEEVEYEEQLKLRRKRGSIIMQMSKIEKQSTTKIKKKTVTQCTTTYSHVKFNDYLNKLIEKDKELSLKKEMIERNRYKVVDKLMKSSQIELDNCNKMLKKKKILINALQNKIENGNSGRKRILNRHKLKQNSVIETDTNTPFNTLTIDHMNASNMNVTDCNTTTERKDKDKEKGKNAYCKLKNVSYQHQRSKDNNSFRNGFRLKELESDTHIKKYVMEIKEIFTTQQGGTSPVNDNTFTNKSLLLPKVAPITAPFPEAVS